MMNINLNKPSTTIEREIKEVNIEQKGFTIPQVQSDFTETDPTKKSYIKNKPNKLSQFENDLNIKSQIIVDKYDDLLTDVEVGTEAYVKTTTKIENWTIPIENPFESDINKVRLIENPIYQPDIEEYIGIYFEDDAFIEYNAGDLPKPCVIFEDNYHIYVYAWEQFDMEFELEQFDMEYEECAIFTFLVGWNVIENLETPEMNVKSITWSEVPILENKILIDTEGDIEYLLPSLESYQEIRNLKGIYRFDGTNWNYVDTNGIVVDKFSELANYDVKAGIKAKVNQYETVFTEGDVTELVEYQEYDEITLKEVPDFSSIPAETNFSMTMQLGSLGLECVNMFEYPILLVRWTEWDYSVGEEINKTMCYSEHTFEAYLDPEFGGPATIPTVEGWNFLDESTFTFSEGSYNDIPYTSQSKVSAYDFGSSYEYLYSFLTMVSSFDYEKGIYQYNGTSWVIDNDFIQTDIEQELTDEQKEMAQINLGIVGEEELRSEFVSAKSYQYFQDYEKSQARTNIGAVGTDSKDFVPTTSQELTEEQKGYARSNINVKTATELLTDFVSVNDTQNFTEQQKYKARNNIGASDFDGNYDSLYDKPTLFSGSFDDLTNKPWTLVGYGIYNGVDTDSSQYIGGTKTFQNKTYFNSDVQINGNIYQQGSSYITEAEHLKIIDALIFTRKNATVGLGAGELTGIQATKYDGTNDGQLVFDKDGIARVGDVGNLQALATREDIPIANGVARWNPNTLRFETETPDTTPTADSTKLITSGGVKSYAIPYSGASSDIALGDYGIFPKYIGINSTSKTLKFNLVGDGLADRIPFSLQNATAQEKSQIMSVIGSGRCGYAVNDSSSNIDAMFGITDEGKGFIGTLFSDAFEFRVGNQKKAELTSAGEFLYLDNPLITIKRLFYGPDVTTPGDYVGQFGFHKEGGIGNIYVLKDIAELSGQKYYYWEAINTFISNENCAANSFISNNKDNMAGGYFSLAVNSYTEAAGNNSFACGLHTKTTRYNSFFCGEYTAVNHNAIFAVGDGTSLVKHNLFEVEKGKAKVNGILEVNGSNIASLIEALDLKTVDQRITSTNADKITIPGFYTLAGSATGVPDSNHSWFLIHQNSSATSRCQIAIGYGLLADKDNITMYVRQRYDTSWGDWIPISRKATRETNISLNSNSWTDNVQTINHTTDTTKELIIRPEYSSALEWANCNVVVTEVTATTISFACATAPVNDLTFRIIYMDVV